MMDWNDKQRSSIIDYAERLQSRSDAVLNEEGIQLTLQLRDMLLGELTFDLQILSRENLILNRFFSEFVGNLLYQVIAQITFIGKNYSDKVAIKDVPDAFYSEVMADIDRLIQAQA